MRSAQGLAAGLIFVVFMNFPGPKNFYAFFMTSMHNRTIGIVSVPRPESRLSLPMFARPL